MAKGGYFIVNYDSTKGQAGITGSDANNQYYEVRRNYVLNKKVCLIHDISNTLPDEFGTVFTEDNKTSFHVRNIGLKYNGTGITSNTIDIIPSRTSISTNSIAYPLPIYEEGSTWALDDSKYNVEIRLNGNVAYVVIQTSTSDVKTITNAKATKTSGTIDWSRYPDQTGDNTFNATLVGVAADDNTPITSLAIVRVNAKAKTVTFTWQAVTQNKYGTSFGTTVLN